MRILFCIGMRVVQTVHHPISRGTDVGRTLCNKTTNIKHFFPGFAHGKHAVRRITMVKKRLEKQGKIPVQREEDENSHKKYCKSYV